MLIEPQFSLQPLNTLATPAVAEYFCAADDLASLQAALDWAHQQQRPVAILGGGSNLLCDDEIPGLVLSPRLLGRTVLASTAASAIVEFAAGESWHQAVCWSLEQELYGLENLALIPGTCGAAPIQNIGAYGVEVAERLIGVRALNQITGRVEFLDKAACELGYRESIFKRRLRHSHIILAIQLELSRRPTPNIHYPALAAALAGQTPSPQAVFAAVCRVRSSKLPDPTQLPNCGSFFKNPLVSAAAFAPLIQQFPTMPHFPAPEHQHKLAAAWLIEQAGCKGQVYGGIQVHPQQALVLTNPQRLSCSQVLSAAAAVRHAVAQTFAIDLEIEPQRLAGDHPQNPRD